MVQKERLLGYRLWNDLSANYIRVYGFKFAAPIHKILNKNFRVQYCSELWTLNFDLKLFLKLDQNRAITKQRLQVLWFFELQPYQRDPFFIVIRFCLKKNWGCKSSQLQFWVVKRYFKNDWSKKINFVVPQKLGIEPLVIAYNLSLMVFFKLKSMKHRWYNTPNCIFCR